ncbi:hypothetical protein D9M70_515580 [compost metagenome]
MVWPTSSRRPEAPCSFSSAEKAALALMPVDIARPAATSAFATWKSPASGMWISKMSSPTCTSADCLWRKCSTRFSEMKSPLRPTVRTSSFALRAAAIACSDHWSSAKITAGAPFGSRELNSRILEAM